LQANGTVSATIDGLGGSVPLNIATVYLFFVNNLNQPITFVGLGPINWTVTTAYELLNSSGPGFWSKNIGMTINTNASAQLSGFYLDWKKGQRWK